MYQISSFEITETQKSFDVPLLEWKFQIENGNEGEMIVSDPLLETAALAEERAISEFIRNSYGLREVTFNTYLTDFEINDIIIIKGLLYKIKTIRIRVSGVAIISSIKAVRYE